MASISPHSITKTSSRSILRLNHYIGLILIGFIFVAVNLISSKQFYRKNISANTFTQISEQTANIIRSLEEPVTIINFVSPDSTDEVAPIIGFELEKLLNDYRYKSNGKIEIRRINPYIDFTEARALTLEQKLTTEENVLILKYRDQSKVLNYRELADVQGSSPFQPGPAKLLAFKAEEAITSAIQSLVAGTRSKVVFLTGHGEYDVESTDREASGYSRLAEYVRRQNADVVKLNLQQTPAIPEDTALIVIAGPRQPYAREEIEMIQAFLNRPEKPGRLLLLLDPDTRTGLEGLLSRHGLTFNNDLAMTRVSILGQVRIIAQAVATTFSEHPVTDWLIKTSTNITLGPCRSLKIEAPAGENTVAAVALALTPESYWGETDFRAEAPAFDKDKDTTGPLVMAAAIDNGRVQGGKVSLQGSKVVAVGGGGFLINQLIGGPQLDFFLNAFNWLLDKENSLGIAPKTPQEFRVSLDDSQKQKLTAIILGVIPLTGALLGFLVWLRRRK
jgi:ABC-type uncharacterized transport system involved in gliding motility auxiliary subunit